MKRILYFTLLLAACFCFWGCDKGDEPEPKPEPEKPFVWNGDWNDPKDPNYKKEGYNPIEGEWISMKDPTMRFVYTKDFQLLRYTYDGYTWKYGDTRKYIINDTGIQTLFSDGSPRSTEEYKIFTENGIQLLATRYSYKEGWYKYKRYTEK